MRRRPAAALLHELDRLSHDGRMRRMVEIGRAASAPDTAALLQDLAGGDVYERRLALQAVYGSQDGRAAATALEDASAALRGLAAQLLARWGEDDQLLAALRGAPPAARRPLLRRFRMHRRLPAIDALVDSLAAGDDPDLPRLLPYASPAVVGRHLALATSTFGLEDWCRLARLHPDVAAAELLREVEAGAGDDPALLQRAGAVLPLLATRRPDAAVALTRALAASTPLSRLPLRGGFFRWTPTQQRRFGDTLREVIEDVQRDSPAVFAAIDALAALPAVPTTTLEALAGPRSRHPAARDTALRALARGETGDGLPALLDAVRPAPSPIAPPDATEAQAIADRAKVATYALRRSLLQMPPTPALAIVREIDTSHLTVAKEVARLLGDLRSEEAFHELLDWERRDDLHRDVRVAVVHAFWGHPDREETWAALQRAAAADTEPAVASAAARMPADRLPPSARRRLLDLLATLLRHPHPAVRLQALQRCATLPVRDDARVLLPPLQAVLRSAQPDLTAAAASAIFGTYAISEPALAGEAIADLRADRRAQRQALEALLNDVRRSPRRLRPAARAALDALAGDPLSGTHQARLAVSAFRGEDLAATLSTLAAREALFADALVGAGSAIERGDAGQEETTLVALERALAGSADAGLRRLALSALIAQSRPPLGWDEARLSRLREYRTDPAPLVAGAATFTLPEAELEP